MEINYETEQKRISEFKPGESGMYWKPTPGQYRVRALAELEEAEPYVEEGKDPQKQAKIDLEIIKKGLVSKGEKVTWTIPVGKSQASAYGQLINLATSRSNKLTGEEFMVVVTNDGHKNSYTIVL